MAVSHRDLWEFLQLLSRGVHCVNLPAVLGEYAVDDGRGHDILGLEGYNELKLRKVGVRASDIGIGLEQLEIRGLGCEKVRRSFQNGFPEVESAVVPREAEFISPNTYASCKFPPTIFRHIYRKKHTIVKEHIGKALSITFAHDLG